LARTPRARGSRRAAGEETVAADENGVGPRLFPAPAAGL